MKEKAISKEQLVEMIKGFAVKAIKEHKETNLKESAAPKKKTQKITVTELKAMVKESVAKLQKEEKTPVSLQKKSQKKTFASKVKGFFGKEEVKRLESQIYESVKKQVNGKKLTKKELYKVTSDVVLEKLDEALDKKLQESKKKQ